MRALWLVLVASMACGRLERVCTMPPVHGMCVNDAVVKSVEYPLTPADLGFIVEATQRHYEARYDVRVAPTDLAQRKDLYVVFTADTDETAAQCDGGLTGCYVWYVEEVFVNGGTYRGRPRSRAERARTLSHELIHFWNRHVLRHTRPDVFEPWGYDQAEHEHLTRGAFAVAGNDTVEYEVFQELLAYFVTLHVGRTSP